MFPPLRNLHVVVDFVCCGFMTTSIHDTKEDWVLHKQFTTILRIAFKEK